MLARVSQGIPGWVTSSIEEACVFIPVRESRIVESPRRDRWDISMELEDGTEVLAWVDRFEQTPAGVFGVVQRALEDAGVTV